MRLDCMYSVYIIFVLACVVKQCWLAWRAVARRSRRETADAGGSAGDDHAQPFRPVYHRLVLLALLGLPIGLSMIAASVFYFLLSGLDLGTAAEQILNGLFNSYVLLAVPLFILAADLMNTGSLTDRLLKFCLVLVGRFRGGLGHVNVVANIIFAGMSGSAIADAVGIGKMIIGMMTRGGKLSRSRTPARSPLRPPSSGRSSRRRFRWSSTRSCPTRRSAISSSAASCRASCSASRS